MAVLETSRLTLRPFHEEDVDLLSELMANPDFMRFSLGVYTREQTFVFLEKIWRGKMQTNRRSLLRCFEARECCSAIAAFIISTLMA